MRMYNKQRLSRYVDRKLKETVESRDAIVWDVQADQSLCRVKVQGSDKFVIAHFPANWRQVPEWCAIGNAVSIRHKKGVRGYIEVIGHARSRPTAVMGGSVIYEIPLSDGIISGLVVTVANPLCFSVSAGVYRYNGQLYSVDGTSGDSYTMGDSVTMGDDPIYIGGSQNLVCISAVPSYGNVRYAVIYINKATGLFGIVAGTQVEITSLGCSAPIMPPTPAGALLLAFVLLVGNYRDMVNGDLNRLWKDSYYSYFEWSWTQGRIGNDPDNPLVDAIAITCWSQYYLPLYGEVTFAVGISYGCIWAPDDRETENIGGCFKAGTPEYHPTSKCCVAHWSTQSIEDNPMKWLILPFDYTELIPPLGPAEYNTIIAISIKREPSSVVNYTENMYWIGIGNGELLFGGDLIEIGSLWI